MRLLKATEKEIEKSILEYLTLNGVFCWKNNSVGIYDAKRKVYRKPKGRFTINGVSDILGILNNGTFLAIEVKKPTNKKRTQAQDDFIANINENGGIAFYASSVEDVESILAKMLE